MSSQSNSNHPDNDTIGPSANKNNLSDETPGLMLSDSFRQNKKDAITLRPSDILNSEKKVELFKLATELEKESQSGQNSSDINKNASTYTNVISSHSESYPSAELLALIKPDVPYDPLDFSMTEPK